MKKNSYIAVPNAIITDPTLYPSVKRVYVALLAYSSRRGTVRKSVCDLSRRSHCSSTTVLEAITALEQCGLVQRVRTYRNSLFFHRKVYAATQYRLAKRDLSAGYTLIPRDLLTRNVTHSAFLVALYLYMVAGRQGRAYPSLRRIAGALCLAKSTVCLALAALRRCQELYRYRCRKQDLSYSCSSYYPTGCIRRLPQVPLLNLGYSIPESPKKVNGWGWSDF